jgi:hypothetical protein
MRLLVAGLPKDLRAITRRPCPWAGTGDASSLVRVDHDEGLLT